MDLTSIKIGFIGAGSMAQGVIDGWLRSKTLKPSQIVAYAPSDRNHSKLRTKGISTTHDKFEVFRECLVVVIACKPYQCEEVLPSLPVSPNHLILSVVGGLSCKDHEMLMREPGTRFVRIMPNVAVAVCEGNTAVVRGTDATDEDMKTVTSLVKPISAFEVMTDAQVDMMSSVSGTGTAWCAMVMEALADGAVIIGLPRHVAMKAAAITLVGAGKLYLETGKHPGEIKDSVCSPGGSTIKGVHALEKSGLRAAMMNAVEASQNHVKAMQK